jgi:hypothetical protein
MRAGRELFLARASEAEWKNQAEIALRPFLYNCWRQTELAV